MICLYWGVASQKWSVWCCIQFFSRWKLGNVAWIVLGILWSSIGCYKVNMLLCLSCPGTFAPVSTLTSCGVNQFIMHQLGVNDVDDQSYKKRGHYGNSYNREVPCLHLSSCKWNQIWLKIIWNSCVSITTIVWSTLIIIWLISLLHSLFCCFNSGRIQLIKVDIQRFKIKYSICLIQNRPIEPLSKWIVKCVQECIGLVLLQGAIGEVWGIGGYIFYHIFQSHRCIVN